MVFLVYLIVLSATAIFIAHIINVDKVKLGIDVRSLIIILLGINALLGVIPLVILFGLIYYFCFYKKGQHET